MIGFTPKDPDDIDDFTWDWAKVLASGETITAFTALIVSGGLAVSGTPSISGTKTTARVTGGTAGQIGQVRGRITTSAGRQLDETAEFQIRDL